MIHMYIIRQIRSYNYYYKFIKNFKFLYCVLHQLRLTKLHENIDVMCPQYV